MTLWIWLAFIAALGVILALNLSATRKRPGIITPTEALLSTFIWLAVATGVGVAVSLAYRHQPLDLRDAIPLDLGKPASATDAALQFIAAYVVEIALSLDNVAVLALLFAHFGVPDKSMGRVLFWAILACLIARAALLVVFGQALALWWMPYLFGGLLALAMLRTLLLPDESTDFEKRTLVRIIRRLPWKRENAEASESGAEESPQGQGARLGRLPVAAVALAAAAADITFATDSVPAVYAVTQDPLIAITSNLLAVLALRSLYFALRDTIGKFRFLKLSVVLVLLGMVAKSFLHRFDVAATLITLVGVLAIVSVSIAMSMRRRYDPATMDTLRPAPLEDIVEGTLATRRNLRKIGVLIAGTSIVFFGILIAPIPGPGPVILVPIGLALLATEFVWAKSLLDRFKAQTSALQERANTMSAKTPIWLVPIVVLGFWAGVVWLAHAGPFKFWKVYVPAAGLFLPIGYWAWKSIASWRSR